MRSAMWCFILLFALMTGSFGGSAFAESEAAKNTASDQAALAPTSSSYASAMKTNAAVHPDSSTVKQNHSPQESSQPSSGPKPSFWQRISGKKVDCSSGVCIVK